MTECAVEDAVENEVTGRVEKEKKVGYFANAANQVARLQMIQYLLYKLATLRSTDLSPASVLYALWCPFLLLQ